MSYLTLIFFDISEIQLEPVGQIETPQVDPEGEAEANRSAPELWMNSTSILKLSTFWKQLLSHSFFEQLCY